MVFTYSDLKHDGKDTGAVVIRITGKYLGLLLIESMFGLIVGLSNLIVIIVLILGWRRLMKNHFYIELSLNLRSSCPTMSCKEVLTRKRTQYEFFIFNVSVFADYGVLFFSVLIAINRFITVRRAPEDSRIPLEHQGLKTGLSCALVWVCSALIPVMFFFFECQLAYDVKLAIYRNKCIKLYDEVLIILFDSLIYLSYACAIVVLVLYLLILLSLRRQRLKLKIIDKKTTLPKAQMQLLKQSVIVFVLYAASILSVFAMSLFPRSPDSDAFDFAYVENLLNLSIAAVYPICFLTSSGEMRSILARKFIPRSSWVSSIRSSSNNNRIGRNEISP